MDCSNAIATVITLAWLRSRYNYIDDHSFEVVVSQLNRELVLRSIPRIVGNVGVGGFEVTCNGVS